MIDGDTIALHGKTIRLVGFDAWSLSVAGLPLLMILLCSDTAAAVNPLLASGGFVPLGALAAFPVRLADSGTRQIDIVFLRAANPADTASQVMYVVAGPSVRNEAARN